MFVGKISGMLGKYISSGADSGGGLTVGGRGLTDGGGRTMDATSGCDMEDKSQRKDDSVT